MRILQVCLDPGIAYGASKGAAVHLAELARAFATEGADVTVVAARVADDAPVEPGITVVRAPGPPRGAPLAERLAAEPARARWLRDLCLDRGADVVHERYALHTAAAGRAARSAGVAHLVEVDAPLPEEAARYRTLEEPELALAMEAEVLAGADLVLPVSGPLAAHVAARGARAVRTVPNAVDPDRHPQPADAAAGPVTAVFTGSLRPWHGSGTLADAWAALGAAAPRLLVVGDGDAATRRRLEGVGARVTGMVAPTAVPALLASAQIGLAPYPADAPRYFSPLKLFEYLAAGLPVVAADLPGVTDVAGDVAVVVPPGDVGALAAAVAALEADPTRRAALGAAGRALVAAHHTWRHRARTIMELADRAARRPALHVPTDPPARPVGVTA